MSNSAGSRKRTKPLAEVIRVDFLAGGRVLPDLRPEAEVIRVRFRRDSRGEVARDVQKDGMWCAYIPPFLRRLARQ